MVDVTNKSSSYRVAIAQAIVQVSTPQTIKAVKEKTVPKGDAMEAARIAAILAVKKTPDVIPHCHPIPIEYANVDFSIANLDIKIAVEVRTVSKTGVEVEAMHGVSIAALTLYDMLKPIDKNIEIHSIKLLSKKGGKSDYGRSYPQSGQLKAAIIVCSDSISAGKGTDKSGRIIKENLLKYGVKVDGFTIIPDDEKKIRETVLKFYKNKFDLIVLTGGTGLSSRDVTPEVVKPLLDREIPGIMETARRYGMERMPFSMLSRSIAGFKGNCLILTLPGSASGAQDYMDALFPQALHAFNIVKGVLH